MHGDFIVHWIQMRFFKWIPYYEKCLALLYKYIIYVKRIMYKVHNYNSAFFSITPFTQLYVKVGILRACGKQSLTHYFSKRGDFFFHKASFTPSLFIKVSVPNQKSERSCIYMLDVSILPISTILSLNFRTLPTICYFFLFILLLQFLKYKGNIKT